MFRAEASALLAIPAHPNLARFVTFDTGSKPKPILVMELVEGQNLDHGNRVARARLGSARSKRSTTFSQGSMRCTARASDTWI